MNTEEMQYACSSSAAVAIADEISKRGAALLTDILRDRQVILKALIDALSGQDGKADEKTDKLISDLKDFVQTVQRDLSVHVDNVTGRVTIQVVDSLTNKVVRQISEDDVLSLAQYLEELLRDIPRGMLMNSRA